MFTRLAKGILGVLVVVIIIAAYFVGVAMNSGIGFIVALGIGTVILMFFGLFVELCNNILDIKNMVSKGAINNTQQTYSNTTQGMVQPNMVYNTIPQANVERDSSADWFCRYCGAKNKAHTGTCLDCGKAR